jgi:iron complex outermembrane recepter protein
MAYSTLKFGSIFALGIAIASPAFAQEAAEEESGIRDIVVTAQKRSENIQSVPIAVSALDEQALAQASVKDVRDLAGRVPSLVVDSVSAGPRGAGISIRGISFEDIEKSFDPAVGVVVDGVAIGTNTGQLLDVFDLESIEVLRGPQGTLFGRNTIGGVINIKRSKPTGEFGVKASVGLAEFATKRGRLVINTPEIGNFLSLKGFVYYDDTGGYYRNVTLGTKAPNYEVLTGGVTALIQPSDSFSATITYEHTRERGETATSTLSATPGGAALPGDLICLQVPVPGVGLVRAFAIPDAQCDRERLGVKGLYTIFGNVFGPVRNNADAVTGEINIDLGGFDLVSVTGYQRNSESVRQDFDSSSINFFDTLRIQKYRQISQEVRLSGDITEGVNILVGGYYFDSHYKLDQTSNLGFVPATLTQNSVGDSTSYAAFSDIQFKVSDRLKIGVGGRYTRDRKKIFNNYGQVAPLVQLSIPTWAGECVQVIGLIAPGVPAYGPANNCNGSKSFGKFTWRAHVDYEIGDHKLIYASFSKGFRSGGFNGRAGSPTSLGPYNPETVDAYEVGLKADWLDRTLRTNFALFRTNYGNKQEEVVQPSPPGSANPQETVVRNAATARINGFEAEVVAAPTDGLTFTATISVIDAKYTNFLRGGVDFSTLNLRRAPDVSWSLGMDYSRKIGAGTFGLSTNFRFIDKYATSINADPIALAAGIVTNDRRSISDTRETLDATLSYAIPMGNGEVKFSIYGRNLLDDRGIGSTLPVAGLFTFAGARPPRQFGGEIGIKF